MVIITITFYYTVIRHWLNVYIYSSVPGPFIHKVSCCLVNTSKAYSVCWFKSKGKKWRQWAKKNTNKNEQTNEYQLANSRHVEKQTNGAVQFEILALKESESVEFKVLVSALNHHTLMFNNGTFIQYVIVYTQPIPSVTFTFFNRFILIVCWL